MWLSWDLELATPGSAVRCATDCAMGVAPKTIHYAVKILGPDNCGDNDI